MTEHWYRWVRPGAMGKARPATILDVLDEELDDAPPIRKVRRWFRCGCGTPELTRPAVCAEAIAERHPSPVRD